MYYTQKGWTALHKFGHLPSADASAMPEDVWDGAGIYPFPLAALETTVVSDNTEDSDGGNGANSVLVEGVDENYKYVSELVMMNGTSIITLTTEFLRVFRVTTIMAGSSETNLGVIQVKHGATVIAQINSEFGQTLMAIFTIPDNWGTAYFTSWFSSIGRQNNVVAEIVLQARREGEAWNTKEIIEASSFGGSPSDKPSMWVETPKRMDIRIRIIEATVNNISITAGFNLVFVP